jgi:polyribonucleotide nucleotidyltransferase
MTETPFHTETHAAAGGDAASHLVRLFGKRDGLVHVSQIEGRRLNHPSDVLKEGQEVWVKLLGFDDRGKVRLAMKMVDQATGKEMAEQSEEAAD